MKTYESSAKTIEEAISAGLEALGASISDVTVDIIDEGSKGLFGLFGSRLAKVRLTLKEQEEDLLASLTEEKAAKKPARKPAEKKEKAEPKQEKPKAEKAEKPAAEKKPLPPKAPAKPIEKPVVTMRENDQVEADAAAGKAQAFCN